MGWLFNVLAGLLLAAVFLRVIATIVPGLDIEDMAAAFQAAILMTVVQNFFLFAAASAVPYSNEWLLLLYSCIATVLALAIAAMVVRGVRIEGPLGVVIAGVLLTGFGVGLRYGLRAVHASGLVDALTQMAG